MTNTSHPPQRNQVIKPEHVVLEDVYDGDEDTVDPVYHAKSRIINKAVQEIGFGRYHVYLFCCAGFGWFVSGTWPLITGLILTPIVSEFGSNEDRNGPFLVLAFNIGLTVGAIFWAFGCDIWGRRWSFNLTLLTAGLFGVAVAGSINFVALASLVAVIGFGVGGCTPVDSTVFLDFVPGTHQYLLTVLNIWWSLGQLVTALIAWPLMSRFSCDSTATPATCSRSDNMGWRYLSIILGSLTLVLWFIRFFVFNLLESPRFLVGLGRDSEAAEVVRKVATFNGAKTEFTVMSLEEAGRGAVREKQEELLGPDATNIGLKEWKTRLFNMRRNSNFGIQHVKALFRTQKLAFSTSLLIALWGMVGLATTLYDTFLPSLLASRGNAFDDGSLYITYRNQVIINSLGIPGSLLAGWAVEHPFLGRRGTTALSTVLSGVFLFASTTATSSNALLGWNCGYMFFENIMWAVLYAVAPEVFPAVHRGTGMGLASASCQILSIVAPVVALYGNIATSIPVYVSGGLMVGSGLLSLLLPYEPRGKASI